MRVPHTGDSTVDGTISKVVSIINKVGVTNSDKVEIARKSEGTVLRIKYKGEWYKTTLTKE